MKQNDIVYVGKDKLSGAMPIQYYYDAAIKYKQTGCGISFSGDIADATAQLMADSSPLLNVWNKNVKHYAALDTLFYPSAVDSSVDAAIAILQELRSLQRKFRGGQVDVAAFIFVGAIFWLSRGKIEEPEYISRFNDMVRDGKPDAVVLVTTFFGRNPFGCRISGPNPWLKDAARGPPTFVNTLELRRSLTIPKSMRQLLTFSVYGVAFASNIGQTFDGSERQGSVCNDSYLISQSKRCVIPKDDVVNKDEALQQVYMVKKHINTVYVCDTFENVEKKICWSATRYSFTGGYAMLAMELSDYGNVCHDTKYGGDFAIVHYMKEFLDKDYQSC